MKQILQAENIYKNFSKTGEKIEVLKNISFNIKEREIIVLMGPSGSGKTTLLNILGTLDQEYEGTLIIDDKEISTYHSLEKVRSEKIGFVFQFHHLLPEFTIYENVEMPLLISGKKNNENRVSELLNFIGLADRLNHYPNEISGGERQRASVMRAIIHNPQLIIADEPTGNLDSENSILLLNLIMELRAKSNQSFLIATHDDSIKEIADKVLYLDRGRIKER